MKRFQVAVVVLLLLSHIAPAAEPDAQVAAEVKAVAKSCNEFGMDLYSALQTSDSNLFFSPYSIWSSLAMASAGAKHQTEKQMADVLHFSLPPATLHPACRLLRAQLTPGNKSPEVLRIANRAWGQQGMRFVPEFLDVTKSEYGAELGTVNFKATEAARKTINLWVDKQTEHKIPDLIFPGVLDSDSRLVLTNAVYFKANWAQTFSKKATANATFRSGKQRINVPLMQLTYQLQYAETDTAQFLELPYVGDLDLSMMILLPRKHVGLKELEVQLTEANLQMWTSSLAPRGVKVFLPRFKVDFDCSLKETLIQMGMKDAFARKADFTGIASRELLWLTAVLHKATVDVNEEGTEAVAATAGTFGFFGGGGKPSEPVVFRADHPFVFLIRDDRTKTILFLGRLINP